LAAWYPRRSVIVEDVLEEFKKFDLSGTNEDEAERLDNVQLLKLRGKGPPKKKRVHTGMNISVPTQTPQCLQSYREAGQKEEVRSYLGWLIVDVYYDTRYEYSIMQLLHTLILTLMINHGK
jgi:hypothetical protein